MGELEDEEGFQDSLVVTLARFHPPLAHSDSPAPVLYGLLG